MMRTHIPQFEELDRAQMEALLARNHVGRIAYSFRDRVDIEPLHYVYDDGWLYGRTEPGSKVATLEHHHWVAFEVDEVESILSWRSVVVHGAFYPLSGDGSPTEQRAYEQALAALRQLVPETLRAEDPVPFRTVVFRIAVDTMSGRAATAR